MTRTLVGILLVLTAFVILGAVGWYVVKDRIKHQPEYRLYASRIRVSPPPDWVPDRFVDDVLWQSGLNQTTSLLDAALPQKLAEAFSVSPWVCRVESVVLRYPSGADVQLSYRVPVALVEVSNHGFFPIDRNGIVLPSECLPGRESDQLSIYFVIQGIESKPIGLAGTPWGDPRVHAAAQLADVLSEIAGTLQLNTIIPAVDEMPNAMQVFCKLRTVGGTEFHWGVFVPDESVIEFKKRKLWDYREQFRSLDNVPERFRDLSIR